MGEGASGAAIRKLIEVEVSAFLQARADVAVLDPDLAAFVVVTVVNALSHELASRREHSTARVVSEVTRMMTRYLARGPA